jgi:hypothetical protein
VAIYPIFRPLYARITSALVTSHETQWIQEQWWNRWYSWIFFGGPGGRWVIGTALGLRELQQMDDIQTRRTSPGSSIEKASLMLLSVVCLAVLLSCFALVGEPSMKLTGLRILTSVHCQVMAIVTVRDISGGRTTLDSYRTPRSNKGERYICVPQEGNKKRQIIQLQSEDSIYDLGIWENWRLFFGRVAQNHRYIRCLLMTFFNDTFVNQY